LWGLWLARNNMIFQDKDIPTIQVGHQTSFAYGGSWKPEKVKAQRIIKALQIVKNRA